MKDKANIWQSTDKFDITNKGEFVYIEKILEEILIETEPENSAVKNNNQKNIKKRSLKTESKKKVLGNTGNNGPTVLPQDFKNTPGQLWKKGEVNTEGYFTLVNSDKKHKSPKFLTAISASVLEIKGTHF